MKKKLTLAEKLSRRKYKAPNGFLYWALANFVVFKGLEPKFNVHYDIVDKISEEKGPAFLIFNHQSRMDYIWTIRAAYPRKLNFVVGYNEFFRSHLSLILKLAHVIPKKNFTIDLPCMRGVDQIIKKGGIVCFSPEGMSSISGHNQPIVTGTGKLFKRYKAPIYLLKTQGAFLTNTKTCLDERPGRIDARLTKVLSTEDLESMTWEEIDAKINSEMWQDDYEWNLKEQVHYKVGDRLCHRLNDLLYRCPRCGTEFEMTAKGNEIRCGHCGNGATMDDTYSLHPLSDSDVIPVTPTRWFDEERREIFQKISADDDYFMEFDVLLRALPKHKLLKHMETGEPVGKGRVRIDRTGFTFNGIRDDAPFDFHLSYRELPTYGMPIDTSFFSLFYKGEYLECIPDKPIVGKVLLLTEEFGRLHNESNWPYFPWMDWVYQPV